jgi:hypothetical protein
MTQEPGMTQGPGMECASSHRQYARAASQIAPRALILPDTIALSPAEAQAIAGFAHDGGHVIADSQPGRFDAHGKRLATPSVMPAAYRLVAPSDVAALREALGVVPRAALNSTSPVESHWYRSRAGMLLALQVAKPAAAPVAVRLTLRAAARLRDVRAGTTYAYGTTFRLTLDPIAPTLLEVTR